MFERATITCRACGKMLEVNILETWKFLRKECYKEHFLELKRRHSDRKIRVHWDKLFAELQTARARIKAMDAVWRDDQRQNTIEPIKDEELKPNGVTPFSNMALWRMAKWGG